MGHAIDTRMIANDIAEVLSDNHGIDVDSNDVYAALQDFLDALYARIDARGGAR